MKQILFSLLAALIMVGCAREDVEFNQEVPVSHSTRAEEGLVEAGGVPIELTKIGPAASEPVLVFKNYQDILTLLSEMDGMNVEEKIARVKKLVPGFVSIQEQYDIALMRLIALSILKRNTKRLNRSIHNSTTPTMAKIAEYTSLWRIKTLPFCVLSHAKL